ncbi:MAG: aminoglycoside phosphotransferase family protein [Chloroflexota bacterium]|nr:aminoglycoside phosphotransferase family protein [Chloroflexota bacterium]
MDQDHELVWTQPGWLEQTNAWIHAELERQGIEVIGPIEQPHVRPWSTVLRVPTSEGDIYFKATTAVLAHEPALTQALAQWRPDCVPPVLAADLACGWMLMPDFGTTLRSRIPSTQELWHWHRVLPLYAEVQFEMAERLHELLTLGALDRRLATLPTQYEGLLANTEALRIDMPEGLASEEYQRLRELTPRVAEMCERLAAYGIPETLHHEDFHDANIFVRDGRYLLSDWGESGVSHPFCTLLVTLRSIAWRLELENSAPELAQLRDIYLEPWTGYASREELLTAFRLAYQLGMICRALTWHRVVSSLAEPLRAEYAEAVPGWLQEFLNAVTTDNL